MRGTGRKGDLEERERGALDRRARARVKHLGGGSGQGQGRVRAGTGQGQGRDRAGTGQGQGSSGFSSSSRRQLAIPLELRWPLSISLLASD